MVRNSPASHLFTHHHLLIEAYFFANTSNYQNFILQKACNPPEDKKG